jgi:hypothetical protein
MQAEAVKPADTGGTGHTRPPGSEQTKFSFSFLLILDEGGLREGWVKSAYSPLAATARPPNHNKQQHRLRLRRQKQLSQPTQEAPGVPGHQCRLGADSKWFPVAGADEFFKSKVAFF